MRLYNLTLLCMISQMHSDIRTNPITVYLLEGYYRPITMPLINFIFPKELYIYIKRMRSLKTLNIDVGWCQFLVYISRMMAGKL